MILPGMMKFGLGRLVITPAVLEAIPAEEICHAIDRHICGNWGKVSDAERAANEVSLLVGSQLQSVYCADNGAKFFVRTTADRTTTTVFLPADSILNS